MTNGGQEVATYEGELQRSDFPGYPLRYPEPSFHYPQVPGFPIHPPPPPQKKKKNLKFFWTMTGDVLFLNKSR